MPDDTAPNPLSWRIEVEHDSYYRWMPCKDDDVLPGDVTVAATWPGFKLRRTLIPEAASTSTSIDVRSLQQTNADRKAAGLGPRSDASNLCKHLEDGPWPKHFPLESITDIRCDNPKIEARLRTHFLDQD